MSNKIVKMQKVKFINRGVNGRWARWRAILLLAHPVLGSHLHPWLKLSTKIIRNNPFIPPYCHQFLIHCQVFHLKKRRQKSRKCLLFASSTTVSRDFGKWAIAIPLSSVFRLNYLQKKKKLISGVSDWPYFWPEDPVKKEDAIVKIRRPYCSFP